MISAEEKSLMLNILRTEFKLAMMHLAPGNSKLNMGEANSILG